MINKRHVFPIISILVSSLIVDQQAWSAQKKKKKEEEPKKKTVGELLSQMKNTSRGGEFKLSKGNTSLPESHMGFSDKKSGVNLDEIKPPRSSEIYKREKGDKAQYEKILDQQIKELYKLTEQHKTSPNRGELWLRLAEVYVEKAGLVDIRKQDEFDRKLVEFNTGKLKVRPKLDQSEAREYNKKAIQLYEWFVRDYPKDSKIAQAFFFLGYNYFEMNEVEKGAKYYTKLTREYPQSSFVSDAYFALGEYYFENEKWGNAYKEYSYLIKDKSHRLHTFSLYKGAWCLYRLGKTKQALSYLEYIIKNGKEDNTSAGAGKKQVNKNRLESEALRDLVVFYAAEGDPNLAGEYFKSMVGTEAASYLEKLAYYYADKGNKDAARDVFKLLISQNPNSPKSFEFQYQIVQNLYYQKNSPKFKDEMYYWIKSYSPQSEWGQANAGKKDLIENSIKSRELTLRNFILQQHQTAQNSRAPYSQETAMQGYQLYLSEFSSSPFIGEMHFYYGELLYDMNKFDEAGQQYKWVVDNAPQSKFYAKSAANLILSVERSVPTDQEMQKRIGTSVDPVELDPKVVRFMDAGNWYVSKFPNSEKSVEIKFRIGRLFYQSNHFDEAEKVFKEIVQKHSSTKQAEYSANLLLDIFNLKKDYVGLEKTGQELLAVPSIASSKAGADIKEVLEKASFKKGQDLESEKKYAESASVFEKFGQQNSKSSLAVTALFNAGVNYERAGMNGAAIRNYSLVLSSKDPQAEKLKPKVKRLLAKLYQGAGQYEESVKLFKELIKDDPKDSLVANYIYNTAIMYEALGRNKEAISSYEDFTRVNKKYKDNLEAMFSMATLYRKDGHNQQAFYKYKEYYENNPPQSEKLVESAYWVAEFYRAKYPGGKLYNEWEEKTYSAQKRLSPHKKGPGAQWVSKLKMYEAQDLFNELKFIKIPQNPAKQKEALDKKIGMLTRINNHLLEVIKYDSADEIVDSIKLLGDVNEHMASSIINSPIPAGLNSDELKQYKDGMIKFAEPFLNKANDSYKAAVQRGWELDVYNQSYKSAYEKMNKLDSKLYYDNGEQTLETKLINWVQ